MAVTNIISRNKPYVIIHTGLSNRLDMCICLLGVYGFNSYSFGIV
jgi:hypothetical protein